MSMPMVAVSNDVRDRIIRMLRLFGSDEDVQKSAIDLLREDNPTKSDAQNLKLFTMLVDMVKWGYWK